MKKYLTILVVAAGALLILCGCPMSGWNDIGVSPGWIESYYSIKNNFKNGKINVDDVKLSVTISAGSFYASASDYIYNGEQKYYELCEKYGDLKPGGFLLRQYIDPTGLVTARYMGDYAVETAIAELITGIEITTEYPWDADHPQGSSLNDIFDVEYVTFYPFVQSGWILDEPKTFVHKPLEDLCAGDLKLLSSDGIVLSTSVMPPAGERCQLTVKLLFDTGVLSTYRLGKIIDAGN